MQPACNVRIKVLLLAVLLAAGGRQALSQAAPPPSQTAAPPSQPTAPATAKPGSATKKPSTADDNPFPEDISRKAAEATGPSAPSPATQPPVTPATAPAKSAPGAPPETDSSSRSKFEGLAPLSDDTDRISNGAGGYINNPKLAASDVKVGGLYLDEHDYKGAYDRYKEATRVDPENADAVFGLAEAARGLKKNQEAVQNYLVYLDAFPDGKKAKEARKALSALGAPATK
jgi:hypothetical protein